MSDVSPNRNNLGEVYAIKNTRHDLTAIPSKQQHCTLLLILNEIIIIIIMIAKDKWSTHLQTK